MAPPGCSCCEGPLTPSQAESGSCSQDLMREPYLGLCLPIIVAGRPGLCSLPGCRPGGSQVWASGFPSAIGWVEQVLDGHGGQDDHHICRGDPSGPSLCIPTFIRAMCCAGPALVSLPSWASSETGVRSEDWWASFNVWVYMGVWSHTTGMQKCWTCVSVGTAWDRIRDPKPWHLLVQTAREPRTAGHREAQ